MVLVGTCQYTMFGGLNAVYFNHTSTSPFARDNGYHRTYHNYNGLEYICDLYEH